jgi:hypothetical protein
MQSDKLDQRPDLRLRPTQQDRASSGAQAAGEHREIEHQRRVGEHEIGEVDDDVCLRTERAGDGLASAALRRAVLIAGAPENSRCVVEVDDRANLPKSTPVTQGPQARVLS